MEKQPVVVGFRFHPTDDELINHYLTNKNLGNTSEIEEFIREINIYDCDPVSLPSLSRIQSGNRIYYFFAPKQYKTPKKTARKRCSGFGKWKPTGVVTKIKDKSGKEIWDKTVLVYQKHGAPPKAKGMTSSWSMHEYQITNHHLADSYVICKIFDKRNEAGISYGNNSSEPSQSLVSDANTVRAINRVPEVEQPGEENFYSLSVNDLTMPMNEQEYFSVCDGFNPDTFFSDYNNTNVQVQQPGEENFYGLSSVNNLTMPMNEQEYHSLVSDSKTVRAINTPPEVEQPGQGQGQEDGLCVDDLLMPMNQQEDHAPWDVLDPSTLYSDNNYPNAPQQSPYGDDYFRGLLGFNEGNFEDVFPNQDFMMQLQENRNDHRPKKPLSGIIVDYSSGSDSDAESISATSYKATSSPNDSVGSSNRHFPSFSSTDSCKDLQTSADPLISRKNQEYQLPRRTIPSKQEAKAVDAESSMVKTEKKGWLITEKAMERNCNNPSYIYLMNTIIGFILLLALIGNILSVF